MSETPLDNEPVVIDDPKKASDVFAAEWSEVRRRRRFVRLREWRRSRAMADDPIVPPDNLTGLALSGGGIRSATFNLGLLQGLRRHGVLPAFDYLSTVSGGGYLGGWWSAWLARDPLFDTADIIDPQRFAIELRDITTRFSGYLSDQFSARGLEALREVSEGMAQEETLQHVVDQLNRVLREIPLYDDALRLGVPMREETRALAMEENADATQVNRMILEDAYPDLLRRQSFIERGSFPPREGIEPERGRSYLYEPDQMGRQSKELRTKISDGALSAGHDPVHHLRLFANYLTPRKGALSGDTWRAIAIFSRNLSLTWMILLPIFLAVMLVGQLYYMINPSTTESFLHEKVGEVQPCTMINAIGYLTGRIDVDSVTALHRDPNPHKVSDDDVLLVRLSALLWPLIPIAGWILIIVVAWMISGQDGTAFRQRFIPWVEVFAMTALVLCLLWIFKEETEPGLEMVKANGFSMKEQIAWWSNWYALAGWGVIGVLLLWRGLRTKITKHAAPERRGENDEIYQMKLDAWRRREEARRQWRKEVRRNRLVRIHSKLLINGVLIAFVLLIAGFSHEAINFIFYSETVGNAVADYLKEAGGWAALLITIAGGIFTAVKASPSGGGDKKGSAESSGLTKLILTVTPTLMVLLIALLAAWWSHGLLGNLVIGGTNMCAIRQHFLDRSEPLHYATFIGIVMAFVFAWYEMKFRPGTRLASRSLIVICLLFAVPLLTMAGISIYARHIASPGAVSDDLSSSFVGGILGPVHPSAHLVSLLIALVVGTFIGVRLLIRRQRFVDITVPAGFVFGSDRNTSGTPISAWRVLMIIAISVGIISLIAFWIIPVAFLSDTSFALMREWLTTVADRNLTGYTVFGFVLLLIYLVVELFAGRGTNNRSIALLVAIFMALAILLVTSYLPGQTFDSPLWAHPTKGSLIVLRVHAVFGLIATFLSWAIALGWTVDPNMLSIHAFYKARLTRAYMGASNYKRHQKRSEITEAVEGDDVQMAQLRNCHRGGPYHLVNTTLNLVGGRDLATAQRSAANFIMTQNYCGSVRTGYRETERYMNGRLTLGTAVSISGAAASPNMGSKTPTAALAMLMTMFNVKLGYWAPTPNRDSWNSPQARLWPFYTLRELTSQTNDLSSYCYLTDGGHFENLGLYALAERGCRYILLSDCGADPQPCFSDLGDAIRRCRIDFGVEFDLEILPIKVKSREESGERYGTAHFVIGKAIYSEAHLQRLRGNHHPISESDRTGYVIVVKPTLTGDESVDVRQYGFENSTFPQQSTGDQWYDEAQFESYRKLGERSIDSMLETVEERAREAESAHDARISTAARNIIPVLRRLRDGDALQPDEIPLFFEGVHALLREKWKREG